MLSLSLCKLDTICEGLNELIPNFARFQIATCSPCQISDVQSAKKIHTDVAKGRSQVEKLAPNSSDKKLSAAAVSNLKGFRAQNKLKKAALTVIRPAFFNHQVEIDVQGLRSVFEKTSCKKKAKKTSRMNEALCKYVFFDLNDF